MKNQRLFSSARPNAIPLVEPYDSIQRLLLLWTASVLAMGLQLSSVAADAESARSADAFVDFVGVNTHVGYSDTTYGDYDGILKPRLLELGVRHIRDGTFNNDVLRKYLDLGNHGIRLLLITDSKRAVDKARSLGSMLFAIEGVNEPDARKGDWILRTQEEQRRLYATLKGDASTKDLPVVVSSLANLRDSPGKLGDLSPYLDFGNMHPYAASQPASRHWGWGLSMERAIAEARKVSGDKPILATECGYHNQVDHQGHPGVTEAAEARYLPRLLFVYFNRGMVKAYKYELLDLKPDPGFTDMERHFGLVRTNGTPKPSFYALKNLLHLLSDPGPAVQTGSLAFQLTGPATNLQHALLQKRDGTFWLALFQEAVSYDSKAHRDLEVPPQPVTLKLPWRAPEVRLYRPNSSIKPTEKREEVDEVKLEVPDEVLLVEIKRPNDPLP
ncbi:MAG TPA: hypothetical protein VJA21_24835 [Verrucomicrobiae bacterium]